MVRSHIGNHLDRSIDFFATLGTPLTLVLYDRFRHIVMNIHTFVMTWFSIDLDMVGALLVKWLATDVTLEATLMVLRLFT